MEGRTNKLSLRGVWTHLAEVVSTSQDTTKLKHSKWVKLTKNHKTEKKL